MKPILVPTDFSPAALSAVNYAADLAIALKAPLVLLHVYQVPVALTETATVMIPVEELKDNAEHKLAVLARDLRHISSGKIQLLTEARLGEVAGELDEVCSQHDPLMVVMGTTGHTALERTLFGSTTLSVVGQSKYPVLVVSKGTEFGTGIKQLALAWDLSKGSEGLPAAVISELVQLFTESMHLVHVGNDSTAPLVNSAMGGTVSSDAITAPVPEPMLQQLFAPVNITVHHVTGADVSEGIRSFAEQHNLDLVIAVPHKHGFFDSLFNQHSTGDIIRASHIPVLCIPAK